MKKILKWVGIGFIAFMILGEFSSAILEVAPGDQVTDTQQQQQEKEEEKEPKAEVIDFEVVHDAFEKNELAAEEKYGGNRYILTVTCDGLETDGLFNMTGGATLTVYSVVDGVRVYFLAEFEKEQEEALKKIEVGETITFEGTCGSAGYWSDCEIVE